MVDAVDGRWPVEDIPDGDRLFMRIYRNFYDFADGRPLPTAFRDHGGSMSTDWEKYSTAEETRNRVDPSKDPLDNAVIALVVQRVRAIRGLRVEHSPDYAHHNRAHVDVFGDKKAPGVRLTLSQICTVEIPP